MSETDLISLWEKSKEIPNLEELLKEVITNAIDEDSPFMSVPDVTEEIVQYILPIIEQYKKTDNPPKKEVIVTVQGGCVYMPIIPAGVIVKVRDYDVDGVDEEDLLKDKDGRYYAESIMVSLENKENL